MAVGSGDDTAFWLGENSIFFKRRQRSARKHRESSVRRFSPLMDRCVNAVQLVAMDRMPASPIWYTSSRIT